MPMSRKRSGETHTAFAIRLIREEEREACASIAEAIDSGRGNEKEIAAAIRAQ